MCGIVLNFNLAAASVASMATTALLLVADMTTDKLSVLAKISTRPLNRVSSTATQHHRCLSARKALTEVTDRLTHVGNLCNNIESKMDTNSIQHYTCIILHVQYRCCVFGQNSYHLVHLKHTT